MIMLIAVVITIPNLSEKVEERNTTTFTKTKQANDQKPKSIPTPVPPPSPPPPYPVRTPSKESYINGAT